MKNSKSKRNQNIMNKVSPQPKTEVMEEASKDKVEMKNFKQKPNFKPGETNSASIDAVDSSDVEASDSESFSDNSEFDLLTSEAGGEIEPVQPKKKKKSSAKPGSTEFAATLAHLISQPSGSSAQVPVLSKSKGVIAKIEEAKLEYKARKILAAERKKTREKDHVKVNSKTLEYEKKLRSIATRGVVMIFNAMQAQQRATDLDELTSAHKPEVPKMSKATFLSMLKAGSVPTK